VTNDPGSLALTYLGPYYTATMDLQFRYDDISPFLYATGYAKYQQFEDVDLSLDAGGPDGFGANAFRSSDGSIVADMTLSTLGFTGNGYEVFVSFQSSSVPEPSSLALATPGLLVLLALAGITHRFDASKPARKLRRV
jgi:hypothetical protein